VLGRFYRQTSLWANTMKESEHKQVAAALESALGRCRTMVDGWPAVIDLVAPRRKGGRAIESGIPAAWEDPKRLLELPRQQLAEQLESDRRSGKQAVILQKLADWWRNLTRNVDVRLALNERSLRQLEDISGISQEMADRICLFALGKPVAPVGRAALRIGCRHGWGELESDREEWQHWLRHWADVADVDLAQLVTWIDQVGDQWCRPKPQCDGCPLASFLPPGGPREPGGDD